MGLPAEAVLNKKEERDDKGFWPETCRTGTIPGSYRPQYIPSSYHPSIYHQNVLTPKNQSRNSSRLVFYQSWPP